MTESTQAENTESASGPGVLKKVNPKDVMQKDIKRCLLEMQKAELTSKDLFTIIGRANNIRVGESAFGPWESLRGEFEATNMETGETFISAECFVPGAAGELLVNQVRGFIIKEIPVTDEQYKKGGKTFEVTGDTVEMALIVAIKESTRSGGAPYEFIVRPIVSVQRADSLQALRERATRFVKALPAPKKVEATATVAAAPEAPKADKDTAKAEVVSEAPKDEKKVSGGKK